MELRSHVETLTLTPRMDGRIATSECDKPFVTCFQPVYHGLYRAVDARDHERWQRKAHQDVGGTRQHRVSDVIPLTRVVWAAGEGKNTAQILLKCW